MVIPPFAIISTGAQHLYNAMYHHPLMRPVHHFRQRLCKASLCFNIKEYDGATGNDRLFSHLLHLNAWSAELDLGISCRSHANNLITIASCNVVGIDIRNDVYHFGVLFQLGGHFARLMSIVSRYVDWALDFRPGVQSAADRRYIAEMTMAPPQGVLDAEIPESKKKTKTLLGHEVCVFFVRNCTIFCMREVVTISYGPRILPGPIGF